MKFKKGEIVEYVGEALNDGTVDQLLYGVKAEIIDTKSSGLHKYLIQFLTGQIVLKTVSVVSKLHDGSGLGKANSCLWVDDKDIRKGGEKKMSKRYDAEDMRSLYNVIVVNPTEEGEVVYQEKVVARDEAEAKFNADIKEALKEKKLKLKDVDIVVVEVGDKAIRPYETVQKVKVIGGADGFKLVKTEK